MKTLATTTFAGGCFWCTEAIFKRIKGVETVTSGYSGGNPPANGSKPSYEQVSSGKTGRAGTIQIKFNPRVVSFEQLLGIFFKTHDPTQLNRQGNDVGEQYRSVVFYHDNEQRKAAEKKLRELETNQTHKSKLVTQIEAFKSFYEAEGYHKDYYDKNRNADYCKIVIDPKIQKLYKEFGDKVKEEYGEKPN